MIKKKKKKVFRTIARNIINDFSTIIKQAERKSVMLINHNIVDLTNSLKTYEALYSFFHILPEKSHNFRQ